MKSGKTKKSARMSDKKSKKQSKAELRAAKREARKGDGSFPDILVVTREESSPERVKAGRPKTWFFGNDEDLGSLTKHDEPVAVYKLRRVSKIAISRKVVR